MDDQHKNFSVWLFRPSGWSEGDVGRLISGGFDEPAEAADLAEKVLETQGVPNQSYAELRFNGDPKPHTVICYMGENHYGIWNTEIVKWPIYYPPVGGGAMLAEFPFEIADDGSSWQEKDDAEKSEKSEEGDMRLDEIEDDEGDDEIEEEEGDDEEDDSEEESPDEEGQPDDDDGDEEESEEEEFQDDDTDDSEEAEEESEEEPDDDLDDDSDDESESEEEMKLPRLPIFAKMRGPLGWRKRAQAEELQEKNLFALKVGILDEEAEKPAQQEREVFLEVVFIETDEDRTGGLLRMKLPEGVMIEDFSERTKAGWISLHIPYRQEGDE